MAFKPKKSKTLSIGKDGAVAISFSVADKAIPSVLEEPVKSLGRVCDTPLTDKKAIQLIKETTENGLFPNDRSALAGRITIWCLQFMLIPKLLQPLLIYDISMITVLCSPVVVV